MKKILSYILLLAVSFSVLACGHNSHVNDDSEQQPGSESSQQDELNRAALEVPYDVPKVLIYTNGEEINTDSYVGCEIVIVDEEGGVFETIRDDASTIKIRGNSTSSGHKKPFNIKFSEKTDVLGMGKNKKWSLLSNCYDKTLIRNLVVFDVAKELGVPYTPDYKVVDVYVDGVLPCGGMAESVYSCRGGASGVGGLLRRRCGSAFGADRGTSPSRACYLPSCRYAAEYPHRGRHDNHGGLL